MNRPPIISREMRDRWAREQNVLKSRIRKEDDVDWTLADGSENTLRLIGGLDISFYKNTAKQKEAIAALVVLTYPDMRVVYEDFQEVDLRVPYKAGFLAFRECPAYHKLLERVSKTEFDPQVLMVDANGILHPRGCGCASHLGVESGYPTIGVAKNLHCVDGLETETVEMQVHRIMSRKRGKGHMPLVGRTRGILGAAMYGHGPGKGTKMPLYVSIGHRLSLESALDLVDKCAQFRIPEPVRQADLRSRRIIKSKEWNPRRSSHRSQGHFSHNVPTPKATMKTISTGGATSYCPDRGPKPQTHGTMNRVTGGAQPQKTKEKPAEGRASRKSAEKNSGMGGKNGSREKGKTTGAVENPLLDVKKPEGDSVARKQPNRNGNNEWTVVGSKKAKIRKPKPTRPKQ